MGAPLGYALDQLLTPGGVRQIDRDYHVAMIAANTDEIVDLHRSILRSQVDQAARSAATNQKLETISAQLHSMVTALDGIDFTLASIAESVRQQNRILRQIAETLSRPYHTQARELRAAAEESLISGMQTVGKEREAHWRDALRLLRETWKNAIGRNDPVVWFQLGWLHWVQRGDLQRAERAFWEAQRLSASAADLYFTKSLRHLAYMKYLRGEIQEPYDLLRRTIKHSRDPESLYDAARYASRAGCEEEAVNLLEECIERDPPLFAATCIEPDFTSRIVQKTSDALVRKARVQLQKQLRISKEALEFTRDTLTRAGVQGFQPSKLSIPNTTVSEAGYLQLKALVQKCITDTTAIYNKGIDELESLPQRLYQRKDVITQRLRDHSSSVPELASDRVVGLGLVTLCLIFLAAFAVTAADISEGMRLPLAGLFFVCALGCGYAAFTALAQQVHALREHEKRREFLTAELSTLRQARQRADEALRALKQVAQRR